MTRYELIKEVKEKGLLAKLISSRCMPFQFADWLTYYETYRNELKTNEKPVSIQYTADYYNVSVSLIYKIIKFFEN